MVSVWLWAVGDGSGVGPRALFVLVKLQAVTEACRAAFFFWEFGGKRRCNNPDL